MRGGIRQMTNEIKDALNVAASLMWGVIPGTKVTAWEASFLTDMLKRWERFGDKTMVSDKQAAIIAKIAAKAV